VSTVDAAKIYGAWRDDARIAVAVAVHDCDPA
jgi:hypothetical protein